MARGSWFEPLHSQLAGVLCNPPYIPSEDISHLQVCGLCRMHKPGPRSQNTARVQLGTPKSQYLFVSQHTG